MRAPRGTQEAGTEEAGTQEAGTEVARTEGTKEAGTEMARTQEWDTEEALALALERSFPPVLKMDKNGIQIQEQKSSHRIAREAADLKRSRWARASILFMLGDRSYFRIHPTC